MHEKDGVFIGMDETAPLEMVNGLMLIGDRLLAVCVRCMERERGISVGITADRCDICGREITEPVKQEPIQLELF